MLKKRSRSIQQEQQIMGQITSDDGSENGLQSDVLGQRQKTNSFFNVPGLFVGLTPKSASDCDSVRSPTSPLDFKLFCNLGTSCRFPKFSQEGHQKCWDCQKMGLGSIVDSLDVDDERNLHEKDKVIPSSSSKTIMFGSQIRSKGAPNSPNRVGVEFCEVPKSLTKNYAIFPHARLMKPSNLQKGSSDVLFEIGGDPLESDPCERIQSFSLDSKRLGSEMYRLSTRNVELRSKHSSIENEAIERTLGFDLFGGRPNAESNLTTGPMPISSENEMPRSLTPEEIELSEDYTCVISHGPDPKTIHIFGDCVLKSHPNEIDTGTKGESFESRMPGMENCLHITAPSPLPSNGFLSCCNFCKNKIEHGKDIFMYRGEKAFCSWECRMEMISIEEELEKSISEAPEGSPKSINGDDIFERSIFAAI